MSVAYAIGINVEIIRRNELCEVKIAQFYRVVPYQVLCVVLIVVRNFRQEIEVFTVINLETLDQSHIQSRLLVIGMQKDSIRECGGEVVQRHL